MKMTQIPNKTKNTSLSKPLERTLLKCARYLVQLIDKKNILAEAAHFHKKAIKRNKFIDDNNNMTW